MRILLFGSSGYIGSEFARQIEEMPNVKLLRLSSMDAHGEYYTYNQLDGLIMAHYPDVIINCAAYTGVGSISDCERYLDMVTLSNIVFPKMLGEICNHRKIMLGHMSTGCVFNGHPPGGWLEDSTRNMEHSGLYINSKCIAEDVLEPVEKKYIWRIRLPFDEFAHDKNLLTKFLKFDRLVISPNSLSHRRELVTACLECFIKEVPFGIYHITNPGSIRNDEVAFWLRTYGKSKREFQYFESVEAFNKTNKVMRSNTILNTDKLKNAGIHMTDIYELMEKTIMKYDNRRT